jgi:hypothetical protein
LRGVKLLQNMDHYERSKLADAIKDETYKEGDQVITEVRVSLITFIGRTRDFILHPCGG